MKFSISALVLGLASLAAAQDRACPNAKKFKYFGVNQAGAEFGETTFPGVLGTDYIWPSTSSIDYFLERGMNTFRINFKMERLTPGGLTSGFDSAYLADLKRTVNYITSKGGYAIGDPHNYGRWKDVIITDSAAFGTWCKNLANEFKDTPNYIFDTNNEYHDLDQQLVFDLNQACIDGIRSAGAKQLILVEGNAWSGAWSWVSSGNAASLIALTDSENNIAYEMHQYLDSDSSGTSPQCVSSTILKERLAEATAWLEENNVRGFLGEVGAGSNDQCIQAVYDGICEAASSGAWIGVTWWAAGPWWDDYFQSIEPPSGPAVSRILPEALMPFV